MAFILPSHITIDKTYEDNFDWCCCGGSTPWVLQNINVTILEDPELRQRASKIFRSRQYKNDRSVYDRIRGRKPGRRAKLKMVSVQVETI